MSAMPARTRPVRVARFTAAASATVAATASCGVLLGVLIGGAVGGSARPARSTAGPVPTVTTATIARQGTRPTPWTASVVVPVVHGGAPAASARINGLLRSAADRTLGGFLRDVPTRPMPKGIPDTSTLQSWVTTDMVSSDLVSLSSNIEIFNAGAAHPLNAVSTATFDARTGAPIQLAGLFRPGSGYLGVLSRESQALLRAAYGSTDPAGQMDPGTTPDAANFQGWSLTPFGLQITFSQDQAGPSVLDSPSVLVPFPALAGVARPGGPIALAEAVHDPRMALLPATTPPAVGECYVPQRLQGPATPTTCAGGRINVVAWNSIAGYAAPLLSAGAAATPRSVLMANCQLSDIFQLPPGQARSFTSLVRTYYSWSFSVQTALAGFPAKCPAYKAPAAG